MILYSGPSQLDGAPVVAIATAGSSNPKTGNMAQVWILRADLSPVEAVRTGADASICGDCPQRHHDHGGCYVSPWQAPTSIFRAYERGVYGDEAHVAKVRQAMRRLPIRIGAYGDPVAVPISVWYRWIASGCGKWTGYTHQWRTPLASEYRELLMASVDSEAEARAATRAGWRYFLVRRKGGGDGGPPPRSVECLSETRGLACEDCGACDGARNRGAQVASIWIRAHGARANRFALPVIR